MNNFHKKYYEQKILWESNYSEKPVEKERIEEIFNSIQPEIKSVLDVGCGNGFFINTLVKTFPQRFNRVVGLDTSEEALKHVVTEKIHGSISNLPFDNESFDLVTVLEVLEHLPLEDFKKGIIELQRISRKSIIITVPNNQNLEISLTMCPMCNCRFNPDYHVRSFNKNDLAMLFTKFIPIEIKGIGPFVKYHLYNKFFLKFYHILKNLTLLEKAICPQCGFQQTAAQQNQKDIKHHSRLTPLFLTLLRPFVNLIFPLKKKNRWLLALYEKTDE